MNNLFLFFVFFVIGTISEFLVLFLLNFFYVFKNKVLSNIIDFIKVCALFFVFQIFVTHLNYGQIRAFFTLSYILGLFFSYRIFKKIIEKVLNILYNKFKEKLKCKKTQK